MSYHVPDVNPWTQLRMFGGQPVLIRSNILVDPMRDLFHYGMHAVDPVSDDTLALWTLPSRREATHQADFRSFTVELEELIRTVIEPF